MSKLLPDLSFHVLRMIANHRRELGMSGENGNTTDMFAAISCIDLNKYRQPAKKGVGYFVQTRRQLK